MLRGSRMSTATRVAPKFGSRMSTATRVAPKYQNGKKYASPSTSNISLLFHTQNIKKP